MSTTAPTPGTVSDPVSTHDRIGVILMAYGTPRTRDEILPYYTDIRRGRPPTDEQLADLVARYEAIAPPGSDILSPLAARTEAQRDALQAALDAIIPGRYQVALGLKHAAPMIEDTVADFAAQGFRRLVGLVLAGTATALDGVDAVLADNRMLDLRQHPGHIFNLGHGVQPDTDPGVLAAVVDRVHESTRR